MTAVARRGGVVRSRAVQGAVRAGAVGLLALATAGCGIRPQDAPARLDPAAVPTESPAARPVAVSVYYGRDGRLVPVRRLVVAPATPEQRLAEVVREPDDLPGLATALARDDPPHVSMSAGVAEVALPRSYARLPAPDQRLAVAQIVLTLTASPDVAVVRFTLAGRPVAVPRGDGSPSRAPLTRADYAALT